MERKRKYMNLKRNFVMSLVTCMSLTMVACTKQETPSPSPTVGSVAVSYKAGTYEGIGTGMGGEVHVNVTFSDNAIDKIEIGEYNENQNNRNIHIIWNFEE